MSRTGSSVFQTVAEDRQSEELTGLFGTVIAENVQRVEPIVRFALNIYYFKNFHVQHILS